MDIGGLDLGPANKIIVKSSGVVVVGDNSSQLLSHYFLALRVVVGSGEAAHAASVLTFRDGAKFLRGVFGVFE